MNTTFQDLHYAIRILRTNPSFTIVAVISLALGIGANTTIYSIVQAVLLQPLPIQHVEQVVAIANDSLSYPVYQDIRDHAQAFSAVAGYRERQMSLSLGDRAERVTGCVVTGNYFDLLGVKASLGRTFLPDETEPNAASTVIISHKLWKKNFGSDRNILDKEVRLNGETFTVIGVAPADFRGVDLTVSPDLWVPINTWPRLATGFQRSIDLNSNGWSWLSVVGRLQAGTNLEQAQTELNILASLQTENYPKATPKGFYIELQPVANFATGLDTRDALVKFMGLLMAVVGIALLIACANVANLLLAHANRRRKEIGVRQALGASRPRIIRQLLTESLLLSLLGGGLGLLLAVWAIDVLAGFELPGRIELGMLNLRLNPWVLGFTFLLSLATGVVFGLAPALRASKVELVSAIKDQGWFSRPRRFNLGQALVMVQVALCLMLLIGAGLFVRSLHNSLNINIGFSPQHVATASINLGLQRYSEARADEFYKELSEQIAAQPRVQSVSWAVIPPLGTGRMRESIDIPGYQNPSKAPINVFVNPVSPNYFQTIGTPLLYGRDFNDQDREESQPVAIINEAMARTYWAGQNALGKQVRMGGKDATIIGIVKDARFNNLIDDPQPYLFSPIGQHLNEYGLTTVSLMVRTDGEPASLFASIERSVRGIDENVPISNVKVLGDNINRLLIAERFASTLLSLFSLMTLVLASIGIYGVIAYSVSQRTKEIGIRLALGAERHSILGLILRQGSLPIVMGIAIGITSAFALTRVIESLLYQVSATDSVTFFVAAGVLFFVALAACYLPARRAMKVDPMVALRYE